MKGVLMLKQAGKVAAATLLAISLCACGSTGSNQTTEVQQTEEVQEKEPVESEESTTTSDEKDELKYSVDQNLDYSLEGGNIHFVRVERADDELTEGENVLLFVYDFTNQLDNPSQAQNVFWISYYQNGTELKNSLAYSGAAAEQYELVSAFYNNAMKGGTVTFAQIVQPKDDSPITVMVTPNPHSNDDEYQMMEVTFGESAQSSDSSQAAASFSTDDVDAALQGTWDMGTDGKWTFEQGSVTFDAGKTISGTYEINADASTIVMNLEATDGTVKATLPFEYDGGTLRVFKNKDKAEELAKL